MGSKQKEISEFIVKIISIVVCIALFGSTYWARKNIGRVDRIAAEKSEYTSSLYCIEERYDRNIEYLKEADSLEKNRVWNIYWKYKGSKIINNRKS